MAEITIKPPTQPTYDPGFYVLDAVVLPAQVGPFATVEEAEAFIADARGMYDRWAIVERTTDPEPEPDATADE